MMTNTAQQSLYTVDTVLTVQSEARKTDYTVL